MHFPFMIDLLGKKIVIIGGGKVAFRKCELFLSFEAELCVVSPTLCADFSALEGKFIHIRDSYARAYLRGAFTVIAATDSRAVNEEVYRDCVKRNIPVNVVDSPELCSFYVPAIARRGRLTIGVSTGGKSPALASKIRKELEARYGDEYAEKLELLGQLRLTVKNEIEDEDERHAVLTAAVEMSCQEIRENLVRYREKGELSYDTADA